MLQLKDGVAERIQKQDPYIGVGQKVRSVFCMMLRKNPNELFGQPNICCLQETHFRSKDTHRLKVREWEKVFHTNGNEKKAG